MTASTGEGFRSTFTSTAGGVMTEEAGAVTGELELFCRPEAGRLHVAVRYAGTDEWCTVSASPVRSRGDNNETQARLLRHLRRPGPVVGENEKATSLQGFPGA
jgi:hypothetical protein